MYLPGPTGIGLSRGGVGNDQWTVVTSSEPEADELRVTRSSGWVALHTANSILSLFAFLLSKRNKEEQVSSVLYIYIYISLL